MISPGKISVFLCFVAVVHFAGFKAEAQVASSTFDISVSSLSADSINAEPGSVNTLVYRIRNLKDERRTAQLVLSVPDSWPYSSTTDSLSLDAGETTVFFATVRPPDAAGSRAYSIELSAFDSTGRAISTPQKNIIVLGTVRSLSVELRVAEEYVPAGQPFTVHVRVTNRSNSIENVRITPMTPDDIEFDLEETKLTLGAFESTEIIASVDTPNDVSAKRSQVIRVKAAFENGEPRQSSGTARVWVLPLFGGRADKAPNIPVEISLQAVGDEVSSNPQIGVRAETRVYDGVASFDMLYAGVERIPMFGTRDYFRLSYQNRFGLLVLGDHTQPISPLTSQGMLGLGVGGYATRGKIHVRGTALRTRYLFPEQTLLGGSVGYQVTRRANLSLNMIKRTGIYNGEIISARTTIALFDRNHELDAECGLDSGSNYETPSCMVELTGSTDDISYRARLVNTSETYPGALENLQERDVALSYRFDSGLRFSGSARKQVRNYSDGFARERGYYRLGGGFGSRISGLVLSTDAHFIYNDLNYTSVFGDLDRIEQSVRSATALQYHTTSLRATFEIGNAHSVSENYDGPIWKSRLSGSGQILKGLTVNITGEYDAGFLTNIPENVTRTSAGFRLMWRLRQSTQVSGGLFASDYNSNIQTRYRSVNAQIRHRLPIGHELSIMIQRSEVRGIQGSQATDYRFSYSVPIGVPDPRTQKTVSSISGRVYDAETGIGIEGVILFLGDTVSISGKDGGFKIPRPRFGIKYLRLDQKSIGFGRVPFIDMPIRIDANTDAELPLEIPVVRAATVSGTVSLWSTPGGAGLLGRQNEPLEKVAPVRGILLELQSDNNLYRVKSDRAGIFSFRNIQAGSYLVKYLSGAIPPNHSFESDSTTIIVHPGDISAQEFRVIPVQRKIRIIDEDDRPTSLPATTVRTGRNKPANRAANRSDTNKFRVSSPLRLRRSSSSQDPDLPE